MILGDTSVGKSCLTVRYVQDVFMASPEPTIGAAFLSRLVRLRAEHGVAPSSTPRGKSGKPAPSAVQCEIVSDPRCCVCWGWATHAGRAAD